MSASSFFQFLPDMAGHGFNVRLKHLHILENGMIDALQYIVGSILFKRSHFIRVVNQPRTQRFDLVNCPLRMEMGNDRKRLSMVNVYYIFIN